MAYSVEHAGSENFMEEESQIGSVPRRKCCMPTKWNEEQQVVELASTLIQNCEQCISIG